MQCFICKTGTTHKGTKSIMLERDGQMLIIRGVAGEICDTCGKLYMSSETAIVTQQRANELLKSGAELQMVQA